MRRRFVSIVCALGLTASKALAVSPDGTSGRGNGGFAGYKEQGSTYTESEASWRVPAMQYDSTTAPIFQGAYQWVGITDRAAAHSLIQAGVIERYDDAAGTFTLFPFYECHPQENIVPIAQTVSVFDVVFAKVECSQNCTANHASQTWNITVQNITKGWTFTLKNHGCVTSLNRAFQVIEVGNTAIPNFGDMLWTGVKLNNAAPSLTSGQALFTYGFGGTGITLANVNPSLPNATSDGFRLCWGIGTGVLSSGFTDCSNDPAFPLAGGKARRR